MSQWLMPRIAGVIRPMPVGADVLSRDLFVMVLLTVALFAIGFGFRGPGRINLYEGALLLTCYIGFTLYLVVSVMA